LKISFQKTRIIASMGIKPKICKTEVCNTLLEQVNMPLGCNISYQGEKDTVSKSENSFKYWDF